MRTVLLLLALLAATPALAQPQAPAERQLLVDMAEVLGEAHALRQLCNGAEDQFWRQRMVQMLEAERPDAAFADRLTRTFNNGYEGRLQQFPACNAAARRTEEEIARAGQALALRLAERSR